MTVNAVKLSQRKCFRRTAKPHYLPHLPLPPYLPYLPLPPYLQLLLNTRAKNPLKCEQKSSLHETIISVMKLVPGNIEKKVAISFRLNYTLTK